MEIISRGKEAQLNVLQMGPEVKVFHIDHIREKILNYAIHNKKGKLSPKTTKSVRRVQKSWLETTSKLLLNSLHPMIDLKLNKTNSLSSADEVKTNGKRLDQFVGRFTDASRIEQSVLPFKLTLTVEYFRKENYQSFIDCLTKLGNELMALEMTYPIDGGTIPFFTFPLLQDVSFQFSHGVLHSRKTATFGENETGFCVFQTLLNGTKNLKKLSISSPDLNKDVVPKNFEFLSLPDTISWLELGLKLSSKELEAVVCQLTNLNRLRIQTHKIPFENDLLFRILQRFQKTLTCFHVTGLCSTGRPCPRTYLRFPIMEKLERVDIDSLECELGPGDASDLAQSLPNLKYVELRYQTEEMLGKWFQNLNGDNVELLVISVVTDRLKSGHDHFYKSVRLEKMTQVHTGFPNLRELVVDLNIHDLTILKYLFENMNYLWKLKINLRGNWKENGPARVTSIMLGIPLEVTTALNFLQTFKLKRYHQPCIRNLTQLRNLTLWTAPDSEDGLGAPSLVSDLLFKQGFLKMPELRNLYFYGKFKPSYRMRKLWRDRHRFIKYSDA